MASMREIRPGVWRFEQSLGRDRHGKRKRATMTFHGGKRAALKAKAEFEASLGVGDIDDITLHRAIEQYLERKEGVIAESSLIALRSRLKTVEWLFGADTKLSKISARMIDDGMQDLLTKGGPAGIPCKPAYVGAVKAATASLLLDAIKHGNLAKDPIPDTKYYSAKAEKRDIPYTDELQALLDALDPRDYRQMAVALVVLLGVRRQEAVALRFADIDEDRGCVHIRHTIRQSNGGEVDVPLTKSEAGMRDLPLPTLLVPLLDQRRAAIATDIKRERALGHPVVESPDYICARANGERASLTSVTKWWCNHRRGFGFKCSLHDLRHTYIQALAEAGVHPAVGAKLGGHTVTTMLSVYTHPTWEQEVAAAESVAEKTFGIRQTNRGITGRERREPIEQVDDDEDNEIPF